MRGTDFRERAATRCGPCGVGLLTMLLVLPSLLGCASMPRGVAVDPGHELTGTSGVYSLTLMTPGWERIAPEHGGYPDADLVLKHGGTGLTVVAHVHRNATATLDWAVLARRELIAEEYEVLTLEEERSLLPGPDYVAISIASYRVKGVDGWVPVLSAAARGKDAVIELIALGGTSPLSESLFADLIAGLRIPGGPEDGA